MRASIICVLLASLVLLPFSTLAEASSNPVSQDTAPISSAMADSERLVLAFYYAWYDANTWNRNTVADMPVTPYNSADPDTITRHVAQAKSAGIDVLVQSWLGPNNQTDSNFVTLLSAAQQQGLRVSLDFETNSPFFSSQDDLVNALKYAINKYTSHPSFLRHQGKPVIFFWHTRQYPASTWQQIRDQVDPNRSLVWRDRSWIASWAELSFQIL